MSKIELVIEVMSIFYKHSQINLKISGIHASLLRYLFLEVSFSVLSFSLCCPSISIESASVSGFPFAILYEAFSSLTPLLLGSMICSHSQPHFGWVLSLFEKESYPGQH